MNDQRVTEDLMEQMIFSVRQEIHFDDDQGLSINDLFDQACLDRSATFLEGIRQVYDRHHFAYDPDNSESLLETFRQKYRENIHEPCPRTIQEWFRNTPVSCKNRLNNYNVCYALEMDLSETFLFFHKYFATIPFNYKDTTDAIFYYAILNHRPYSVIKDLLKEAEQIDPRHISNTQTMELHHTISEIRDDETFLHYMKNHCTSRDGQYRTIRSRILSLMDKMDCDSDRQLHMDVMGFDYENTLSDLRPGKSFRKRLKNQFLDELKEKMDPVRIKQITNQLFESLPTDKTFSLIRKDHPLSIDTLRKTLILLSFHDYYQHCPQVSDPDVVKELRLEFYHEMNQILSDCGLPPLYLRHPFDMAILFCAGFDTPVYALYALNDLRYPNI